jgi:hypothetical protein
MIRLFTALKESEMFTYLQSLGADVDKDQLKSKLFLLQEFKIIKKSVYGDLSSPYYLRTDVPYHRLRLAFKKDSFQDPLRVERECIDYYEKDPKQKRRLKAIRQAQGQSK